MSQSQFVEGFVTKRGPGRQIGIEEGKGHLRRFLVDRKHVGHVVHVSLRLLTRALLATKMAASAEEQSGSTELGRAKTSRNIKTYENRTATVTVTTVTYRPRNERSHERCLEDRDGHGKGPADGSAEGGRPHDGAAWLEASLEAGKERERDENKPKKCRRRTQDF